MSDTFRLCSTCKRPISFEATYFQCSVSTCNRKKLALYFCSVPCWDAHVPEARHRDAYAEQVKAPTRAAFEAERAAESANEQSAEDRAARRRVVGELQSPPEDSDANEVLVVVSKLKKYIKQRSGMNTSDNAMGPLSDHLRRLCNEAIRNAARDGRRTVLDRDFAPLLDPRALVKTPSGS